MTEHRFEVYGSKSLSSLQQMAGAPFSWVLKESVARRSSSYPTLWPRMNSFSFSQIYFTRTPPR